MFKRIVGRQWQPSFFTTERQHQHGEAKRDFLLLSPLISPLYHPGLDYCDFKCFRMADPEKIEKYEHLLNNVLRENLRIVLEERDKVYEDIAAHSQLKQTITCIIESPDQEGLRTKVDLGSNFYVQAHVPDTSRIYVNVGLGFFVELTLQEALSFIDKKLELLNVKLSESTKKSAKIKGQIKFVFEGIRELQQFNERNAAP